MLLKTFSENVWQTKATQKLQKNVKSTFFFKKTNVKKLTYENNLKKSKKKAESWNNLFQTNQKKILKYQSQNCFYRISHKENIKKSNFEKTILYNFDNRLDYHWAYSNFCIIFFNLYFWL